MEMNEIRLNKLCLRDFQGGTITLNAQGKDVFVYGANAQGKTRLVSAFSWLLFNKDALGRSDFEIKNITSNGDHEHGLEHTVEAELDINGQPVTLKKIYKEKWTKKRGNAEREFSGHSTDHFFNGVPVQEKDYTARVAEIAGDESRFRLLTSPMVFPALHWQKQRALLLEVCGDISDADVISSAILGKRTLEDHRKVVTARRTEINKEMEKLPIRIDEVNRSLPITTGIDREATENDVQRLETALNDAKLRLQGIDTGGAIADLTRKLSGLNADLRKLEDAHRSGSLATLNRLNQRISEVDAKLNASRRRVSVIDGDLKAKEGSLQIATDTLPTIRNQWTAIDGQEFNDTIPNACPACGQALPSEKVQDARERALAAFNSSKAERLKEVNDRGMTLRERKERLEGEIKALLEEKKGLSMEISSMESELKQTTAERDTLKSSSEDFGGIPRRADLLDEIEDLDIQIKAEMDGVVQDAEKIKAERATIQGQLTVAKEKLDRFRQREQGEKRIEELKASEKLLSKEFEDLEGQLYLMDQFIRAKVSMLTNRINSKFETVKWKLFSELINGGVEECCEITVNGVGYNSGLNNSARINAGLEIVKVLQSHYQLKAPVFADNAEAVNNLVDVGCQMIRLYVSEDKQLRIEVAARERMAA
jgi:hypothetical protein